MKNQVVYPGKDPTYKFDAISPTLYLIVLYPFRPVFELIQSNGKTLSRPRNSWRKREIIPAEVVGISAPDCITEAEGNAGVDSIAASSDLSTVNRF